jgi:hypothetical protein
VDPRRGSAGFVPHVRGLVRRHVAADRDLRGPRAPDVDPAGPCRPGGHAGAAVGGPVHARPGHGRVRITVLGIAGAARPPDRGDARVRDRGPRTAGREGSHFRADPGRERRARLAADGVTRARGSAVGPGVPGGARPADAAARRRERERCAAQLGHPRADRRQQGTDRRGRGESGPGPGHGCNDDVHPGLRRRRRGRGPAGARRAGARLRHGPARCPADRGIPGAVRPDGVRRGTDRTGAAPGPRRGHGRTGGCGPRRDAAVGRLLRSRGSGAGRVRPAQRRPG